VAASGRSRHSAEHVASLVERLQLLAEQFRGNAQRG
jgi:aerotaxis receptor